MSWRKFYRKHLEVHPAVNPGTPPLYSRKCCRDMGKFTLRVVHTALTLKALDNIKVNLSYRMSHNASAWL